MWGTSRMSKLAANILKTVAVGKHSDGAGLCLTSAEMGQIRVL